MKRAYSSDSYACCLRLCLKFLMLKILIPKCFSKNAQKEKEDPQSSGEIRKGEEIPHCSLRISLSLKRYLLCWE